MGSVDVIALSLHVAIAWLETLAMVDAIGSQWSDLTLAQQMAQVELLFPSISFEGIWRHYHLPKTEVHWLCTEPYYKGLAGFALLSGAQKVIEIGTLFGGTQLRSRSTRHRSLRPTSTSPAPSRPGSLLAISADAIAERLRIVFPSP